MVPDDGNSIQVIDGSAVVSHFDISQSKRTEQALRESEERYRAVVQDQTELICRRRPDTTLTFANDAYCHYFGKERHELVGFPYIAAIPERDRKKVKHHVARLIKTVSPAHPTCTSEYRVMARCGDVRWVQWTDRAIFNGQGLIIEFQSVGHDITDRKEVEAELLTLSGRLIHAHEEERSRIARELHDHFNQRLALMSIRLEQLNQSRRDSSGSLQDSVEALKQQVHDLSTDMHRLSHQLHSTKLDHLGLLVAISSHCNDVSQQHGLRVTFTHHDMPKVLSKEIALCLFRIVQEGLQNVLKHSTTDTASIVLSRRAGTLDLRISDSGVGFDTRKAKSEGLGLLSMTERVRLVGGTFRVESSPGRGTRIAVRVPLGHAGAAWKPGRQEAL